MSLVEYFSTRSRPSMWHYLEAFRIQILKLKDTLHFVGSLSKLICELCKNEASLIRSCLIYNMFHISESCKIWCLFPAYSISRTRKIMARSSPLDSFSVFLTSGSFFYASYIYIYIYTGVYIYFKWYLPSAAIKSLTFPRFITLPYLAFCQTMSPT